MMGTGFTIILVYRLGIRLVESANIGKLVIGLRGQPRQNMQVS
jgi:hypothetical protein